MLYQTSNLLNGVCVCSCQPQQLSSQ